MDMQVCTSLDKWMEDTWVHSTRWVVELSNGETVWQDDGRPGIEDSAWIRLKNYCEYHGLSIKNLRLQFRNNMPDVLYQGGDFFFSKLVRAHFISNKGMADNKYFYLIGVTDGDTVKIDKWLIPALVMQETLERNRSECEDNIINGVKV